VFLDLLPRNGLQGALVMPMVTAGLSDHRGAVQAALRTVLLEMQADLRIPGITLLESEFDHVEKIFEDWWLVNGPALSQVVRQQAADRLARTQSGAERC
jgi:FMN reductase